jgi:hypothetical protein
MEPHYILTRSPKITKKYLIITPDNKHIHFGAKGYNDYLITNDNQKKELYIKRHKSRENWTKSGINTAGFWAKHILWNKKTLLESIKSIEQKYLIKITFKK